MRRDGYVRKLDGYFPLAGRSLRRLRTRMRTLLARNIAAANQRELLEGEPWVVEEIRLADDQIIVSGWALPPANGLPRIELNGRAFDTLENHRREDVAAVFWQRLNAAASGFVGRSALDDAVFENDYARMSYLNAPSSLEKGLRRDFYYLDPARESFPLPDSARRTRVIGNDDEFGFRFLGATDFQRLSAASRAFLGHELDAAGAVLDWGVGCGRIARYALRNFRGNRFVGCDIDAGNVRWCKDNLAAEFHHIGLMPPMPFPADAFDLIYGLSVFTHLREPVQDRWLSELHRVMKPGGVGLFTVHGMTTLDYADLSPPTYQALKARVEREGFVLGSANSDLVGAVDSPEEYVNIYHHKRYVREHWKQWFDIVGIIPGYVFTHDLVVVRKRK